MKVEDITPECTANPIDDLEELISFNDWPFERSGSHELVLTIGGRWCSYQLNFCWIENLEVLHLACALDFKIKKQHRAKIIELLSLINEQLWIGHFDFWSEEKAILYRHALPLSDEAELSPHQFETLLCGAIETCERYYQTFQSIVLTEKSASGALANVIDTVGEA